MSSYANIPNIKEQTGWRVSFWFAVSSPVIGILLGILAVAIFVDDRRSREHNTDSLPLGHSTVRFRFDRTGQDPPEKQLRLTIAREVSEF